MRYGRSRGRGYKGRELHNTRGIMNAMQRVAGTQGLVLKEVEGCTQPRTDMMTREVELEPLNPYWPIEKLRKWKGECWHEVGHHDENLVDMLPLMIEKNLSFSSLFGRMMNLIEDVRNEKNKLGWFPGRDDDLSWVQAWYCTAAGIELAKMIKEGKGTLTPDAQLFADVMGWVYTTRGRWQPDMALPASDVANMVNPAPYEHLTDELDAMVTAEDVYQLVRKILDASPEHDADEQEQKSNEKREQEKKEDEQEGEGGKGDGDKSDDSDSDGKAGPGKPGEGDGDDEAEGSVPEDSSYEKLLAHKHTSTGKPDPLHEHLGKIIYDHARREDYVPWTKMRVVKARDWSPYTHGGFLRKSTELWKEGQSLAGVARRLFQSRTQKKVTHNHKKGRLDKRDLYRIKTGSVDVFKRKESAPDPKGTALFILTDMSGSMSGTKFCMTAASVALLNEAVQPLGVPTEIAAFTEEQDTGCQHYIMKEFHERRDSEDIIEDYAKVANEMCQNADGESVMWAFERLMKRKEPRKILLVLSDGQPASDNWSGDCWKYTYDVIQHCSKHVECYGIGILDDSVKDLYPEYTIISDVKKLEGALLEVIEKKVFT